MVTFNNLDSMNDVSHQQDAIQTIMVQRNISPGVTHIYIFYPQITTDDLVYRKSTDGGATFGAAVIIQGTKIWKVCSVWFSSWTNGSSGTIIHILAIALDGIMGEMTYFSLDAATDTAGTNNDVIIHIFGDVSATEAGCPTICETVAGELFAAGIGASGPVGIQVERSLDSGATWTDIGGSLPVGVANDVQDSIVLFPLVTNDDVLMIIQDQSSNQMESIEFFNATNLWDTGTTLIDTAPDNANRVAKVFGATQDKATGDIYMVFNNSSNTLSEADVESTRFTESSRTWSTPTFVIHEFLGTASVSILERHEKSGFCMCMNETDKTIMLTFSIGDHGNLADGMIPYIFLSSDLGVSWSDPIFIPTVVPDFRQATYMSLMMQDDTDGWFIAWVNDTTNELDVLDIPIPYQTVSGVSRDNDGTTAIAGADIVMVQNSRRGTGGMPCGGGRHNYGHQLSAAGTGAHKIAVIPPFADENATNTNDFVATGYNDNGGVNDEMDASQEVAED